MQERFTQVYRYLQLSRGIKTQTDLANAIGSNRSVISSALRGDKAYCKVGLLHRINAAFGNIFSVNWINTGEGEMLAGTTTGDVINAGRDAIGRGATYNSAPAYTDMQNTIDTLLSQQGEFLRTISNLAAQNNTLTQLLAKK